ncbi:hypothetical protein [Bacillus sp. AK031]
MSSLKLFNSIGAGIFSGMVLMTFIQLHKMEDIIEASGFIAAAAVIYFLLVWMGHKGRKKAFTSVIFVLALLAVTAVLFHHVLFPAPH